jgi:hypothetical protein
MGPVEVQILSGWIDDFVDQMKQDNEVVSPVEVTNVKMWLFGKFEKDTDLYTWDDYKWRITLFQKLFGPLKKYGPDGWTIEVHLDGMWENYEEWRYEEGE